MPIKVLDKTGQGTYADIAEGIIYATDNGANVINLSFGGPYDSETIRNAVSYAYNKGVTIVCATGNDGLNKVAYPAAYDDYCIAVGATRYDETIASYSNRGNSLDLVAPGGDLNVDQNIDGYPDGVLQQTFWHTTNNWIYRFYQGTSMAAPHVTGVAALLISRGIAATPDEVRKVLQATAKDKGIPGKDSIYGYGIVNAHAALCYNSTLYNNNGLNKPLENNSLISLRNILQNIRNRASYARSDNTGSKLNYFSPAIAGYTYTTEIKKTILKKIAQFKGGFLQQFLSDKSKLYNK